MSFGYSISDGVLLGQLAYQAFQNSKKACGEHDGLTREVMALHTALRRLDEEVANPNSPIIRPDDTSGIELRRISGDCGKVLRVLDRVLQKYNALSDKERSVRKLWQRIRLGNGEMADLGDLRSKMVLYTTMILFNLNMVSIGAVGRVEQEMNRSGGVLKDIQLAVNTITTHFISRNNYEGSIFTTYADDDKAVWRAFRRELRHEGFKSHTIHQHKRLILDYIKELGNRGLLDEEEMDWHGEHWQDGQDVSQTPSPCESFEQPDSSATCTAGISPDVEPEAALKRDQASVPESSLTSNCRQKSEIDLHSNEVPPQQLEAKIEEDGLPDQRSDLDDLKRGPCAPPTETKIVASKTNLTEAKQHDELSLMESLDTLCGKSPSSEASSSLPNAAALLVGEVSDGLVEIDEVSPKDPFEAVGAVGTEESESVECSAGPQRSINSDAGSIRTPIQIREDTSSQSLPLLQSRKDLSSQISRAISESSRKKGKAASVSRVGIAAMPKGRSNAKEPEKTSRYKSAHVEDCESDIEINEHTTVSSTLPYTHDEKTHSAPNFTKRTQRSEMEDLAAADLDQVGEGDRSPNKELVLASGIDRVDGHESDAASLPVSIYMHDEGADSVPDLEDFVATDLYQKDHRDVCLEGQLGSPCNIDKEEAKFLVDASGKTRIARQSDSIWSLFSRPMTPAEKLRNIHRLMHYEFVPRCRDYIENMPQNPESRERDYKIVTEGILARVIIKYDEIQTEGDEGLRTQRKELVREAQGWLDSVEVAERNTTGWLVDKLWHTYHRWIAPLCIRWALVNQGIHALPIPVKMKEAHTSLSKKLHDIIPQLHPLRMKAGAEVLIRISLLEGDVEDMIDAMEKIGHNERWSWNDERVRTAPRADGTRSSVRLECHSRNRTAFITSRDDADCAFCALQIRLWREGANSQPKTSLLRRHLKEIATPEESDSEMTEEPIRPTPFHARRCRERHTL